MITLNLNGININMCVNLNIHIYISKYIDIAVIVEPRRHSKLRLVVKYN